MDYGKALKNIRTKHLRLTQGIMAGKLNITQSYLSLIERGDRLPSLNLLTDVSKLVGVPMPVMFITFSTTDDVPAENKMLFDNLYPHLLNIIETIYF